MCKERAEWKKITEKAKTPQWVVTPVKKEEGQGVIGFVIVVSVITGIPPLIR